MACKNRLSVASRNTERNALKKEESNVIAQKLQKIPNGTLALKHCRAGGTGSALFGEQFRAVTAGKGCMEAYETFPGIEVSFNVFLASEVKFRHDASDSVLEFTIAAVVAWVGICKAVLPSI